MTPDQVSALASAVDSLVDDETAVVIAEDFSHYLSAPEAEANDKQTLAALSAMDSSQVALWGNEHLDSPQSVELAIDLARLLGDDTFVLRQNTNSGILSGTLTPPVTSYIAGYFTAR
jgi:AmmeMemoRadiSam system protein B